MKKGLLFKALTFVAYILFAMSAITSKAYDFEVGGIYYNITSSNTVEVTYKGSLVEDEWINDSYAGKVCIPSKIEYNSQIYKVTTVGDSAFFYSKVWSVELSESIISIGKKSFKECYNLIYIKFLTKGPPVINDSFDSSTILLVHEDAYLNYTSNHIGSINQILCFDGAPISLKVDCYTFFDGFVLAIDNIEGNEFYGIIEESTPLGTIVYQGTVSFNYNDKYAYYIYQLPYDVGSHRHILIDSYYAIIDNKYFYEFMASDEEYLVMRMYYSWNFDDNGIFYKFNNIGMEDAYLGISYQGYYFDELFFEDSKLSSYSGNTIIPDSAHFAIWNIPVKSIDYNAFANCQDLKNVTLPASIQTIEYEAFLNCPNLISISCLANMPPTAQSSSFDEQIYKNTVLYVPESAVKAYKASEGWSNFEHIVGAQILGYDFCVDSLYYKIINDHEVALACGQNPYSGDLIVPNEVTYGEDIYKVSVIGDLAFSGVDLTHLEVPVSIQPARNNIFSGSSTQSIYLTGEGEWQAGSLPDSIKTLYIGNGVTGVKGMRVNPETIYCYATVPPVCDENSFIGYDAELHVPAASLAAYFTAPYWCNFTNIVGDAVPLIDLSLNQDSIEVLTGNKASLKAALTPTNAAPSTVTWLSSNESVATVENGVVSAIMAGECDIIASCQDQRVVCHVVVTEILPTSITLDKVNIKVEVGSQFTLTATVQPENATYANIIWRSTNQSVATVDENGVVTAVGPGECNITAWCRGKEARCHVIVVEQFTYIVLDKHEVSVLPNHILTLTPRVWPMETELVVTSSNPSIAAARMAKGKIQVVGVSEGRATIYINSSDGYAEPDSCVVNVYTEMGDVNGDGFVNITDVSVLIDYLLGDSASAISEASADTNSDGEIAIGDVSLLIDYLLGSVDLNPAAVESDVEEITVNGVKFNMVCVEGGVFEMGCTVEQDPEADAHEAPVHLVSLSSFYIGQNEVTQELWQAVMGENPSEFNSNNQHPVERVTWDMCQEFIARLNELTGRNFHLPTEAQWEYAARGGNKSEGFKYAGSDNIDEVAWYKDNCGNATHPVGLKKANELGLYDMCGNANEWCADWYSLYTEAPQTNPSGSGNGLSRIYRGGGWMDSAKGCRVPRRTYFAPTAIRSFMGLRLAL